ncbi:MAG: hypothetical protein WDZ51_06140 [Pirellulaceae bacterium]
MSVNTSKVKPQLDGAKKSVNMFTGAVNVSGAALTAFAVKAAAIIGPLIAINNIISTVSTGIKTAMSDMDQTAKHATKLGLPTQELIALRHAAELSGVSSDNLDISLQRMTRRLAEAAKGGGSAKVALEQLGLNAAVVAAKSPHEAIRDIADAMKDVTSQSERVSIAFKLFDSGGVGLVNTLKNGSAALDDAKRRTEALGISFSNVDAAHIELANDAIFEMREMFKGVFQKLTIELVPIITVTTRKLIELGIQGMKSGGSIANAILIATDATYLFLDSVDLISRMWKTTQAITTKSVALMIRALDYLAKAVELFASVAFPLMGISFGETLNAMANEVNQLAHEQAVASGKAWNAPIASTSIKKFLGEVKAEAKEAAKDLRKTSMARVLEDDFVDRNKSGISLIDTLNDQIMVLKHGERNAQLFKLANEGVDKGIFNQVRALMKHKQALEDSAKATEELRAAKQKLKDEADSIKDKFKSPIVSFREELNKLRNLLSKGLIDRNTFKAAALDALPEKVKAAIELTKTPLQKFNEELKELQKYKAEGLINPQAFSAAVKKLRKELFTGNETTNRFASAAEYGSQEARSAILRSRGSGRNPILELHKTEKSHLDESKKQTVLIGKIVKQQPRTASIK